jgi:hypothetical protein
MFKVALFLTKSKELADDITQETFIQVLGVAQLSFNKK